ncbi:MAG: helix-turn-helix domain-containing protein [Stenotrophobium sp.]
MKKVSHATDEVLLKQIGGRLEHLRLAQNLTQAQLAEQAGLGLRTVQRLESGAAATQLSGFIRVCRVLGLVAGFDALIPEPVASPVVQLKLQGRTRKRASGRKPQAAQSNKWSWVEPS